MQQAKEKEGRAIAPREVVNLVAKKNLRGFYFFVFMREAERIMCILKEWTRKKNPNC